MGATDSEVDLLSGKIADDLLRPIVQMSPEESWAHFDGIARARLGISGEEFLRSLDAGAYADIVDDHADHPWIGYLAQTRPRAR